MAVGRQCKCFERDQESREIEAGMGSGKFFAGVLVSADFDAPFSSRLLNGSPGTWVPRVELIPDSQDEARRSLDAEQPNA